jgi:predicted nucleic acid-binding Zn ribbon protein
VMGRQAPRPGSLAVRSALELCAPRTVLAAAQTAWREAVGEGIAAAAEPVAERDGVLTIRCESATWAQELSLMQDELLRRLSDRLDNSAPRALRFLAG